MLNRFCTDQGHCRAYHKSWSLPNSDLCDWRGADNVPQSTPALLTSFDGGLQGLSSADADALAWLNNLRP